MVEKRIELKTYRVIAACECGGQFEYAGTTYPTYPMRYSHRCTKCGKEKTFLIKYPYLDYQEKENTTGVENEK